jgi:hypothetical protein
VFPESVAVGLTLDRETSRPSSDSVIRLMSKDKATAAKQVRQALVWPRPGSVAKNTAT